MIYCQVKLDNNIGEELHQVLQTIHVGLLSEDLKDLSNIEGSHFGYLGSYSQYRFFSAECGTPFE